MITRALLTWSSKGKAWWETEWLQIIFMHDILHVRKIWCVGWQDAYNGFIQPHPVQFIEQPTFGYVAPDSHPSLYLRFRLLLGWSERETQQMQKLERWVLVLDAIDSPWFRLQSPVTSSDARWFQILRHPQWRRWTV
jgi:hypothetical protein